MLGALVAARGIERLARLIVLLDVEVGHAQHQLRGIGALDAATLQALLADPTGALADLLKYHVVAGTYKAADLSDEQMLTSLTGQKIRFNSYTHNNVRVLIYLTWYL